VAKRQAAKEQTDCAEIYAPGSTVASMGNSDTVR
jgi:hypothetical protein